MRVRRLALVQRLAFAQHLVGVQRLLRAQRVSGGQRFAHAAEDQVDRPTPRRARRGPVVGRCLFSPSGAIGRAFAGEGAAVDAVTVWGTPRSDQA